MSRFRRAECVVQRVTQFLTFAVVPALLYLDCACLRIGESLVQPLLISLMHVFLIYVVADVLIRRVDMRHERKAAAILTASLPNVVYLPYSVYAVFSLDTAPLVPYVLAANMLLPVALARAQLVARPGCRIRVRDLAASIMISAGIGAGLATAVLAPHLSSLDLVFRARQVLSCIMLLAFMVLGHEIARIRAVTRDMLYPLMFRIVLSPLLMMLMLYLVGAEFRPEIVRGLLVESLAPSAIATVLYSRLLGFDTVYAAAVVSVTTLIALPAMLVVVCSPIPSI